MMVPTYLEVPTLIAAVVRLAELLNFLFAPKRLKQLVCFHKWAYPLRACQKGCGATTDKFKQEPRNLEDKILLESKNNQQPKLCKLRDALKERVDTNSSDTVLYSTNWACCSTHSDYKWSTKKRVASFFGKENCYEVYATEEQLKSLNVWLHQKESVVLELPVYKYPVFFGPDGLIQCSDKEIENANI